MHERVFIPVLVTIGIGVLRADNVTYTVTPSSGSFLYQFTLSNTGATGGTLFDLFLSLPTDISNIDTGTIGTPAGWGDPTGGLLFFGPDTGPGTAFLEWSNGGPPFDLAIGSSLSGFSFNSSVGVGQPIMYGLNGSADLSPAQPQTTSTPEPATFWLLLIPAVAAIVRWHRFPGRERSRMKLTAVNRSHAPPRPARRTLHRL
jgi:hypothetical protein